jgi:hypothetical protein
LNESSGAFSLGQGKHKELFGTMRNLMNVSSGDERRWVTDLTISVSLKDACYWFVGLTDITVLQLGETAKTQNSQPKP